MPKVYLLRHAPAVEASALQVHDRDRPLSDEGRQRWKEACEALPLLRIKPKRIFTSPYLRAQQTAERAAKVLDVPVEDTDALTPDGDMGSVVKLIAAHMEHDDDIMIVSHNPFVSELAQTLIHSASGSFGFKKGALLCLEQESRGSLFSVRYFLNMAHMEIMAKAK